MTVIHRSAIVPYSAHEMFQLVADVESYPRFLPWCGGATVLSREGENVVAAIDIAYKGVNKRFTTRNRLRADERLDMELVEGPFQHLQGHWQFQALDDLSCKIALELGFEFSNRMLGLVVGPVFSAIATSLVDSFHRRAVALYGER